MSVQMWVVESVFEVNAIGIEGVVDTFLTENAAREFASTLSQEQPRATVKERRTWFNPVTFRHETDDDSRRRFVALYADGKELEAEGAK